MLIRNERRSAVQSTTIYSPRHFTMLLYFNHDWNNKGHSSNVKYVLIFSKWFISGFHTSSLF